ncbi:MAG: hypothetical protein MUF33_15745 [Candidatus Nanopelagicales bacterium]|nr:hypothetical protein [Candidatus Nanopelagicales bacterium]
MRGTGSPNDIPAVEAQDRAGHEGRVAEEEHHRGDHVVCRAGAAEQGVAQDGLPLAVAQQAPAAGARAVAGVDKAQHDLVDAHLGCGLARPALREQRHRAVCRGVAVVEHRRSGPAAPDQPGDGGDVDHGPVTRGLEVGQGGRERPALGAQRCLLLEVPLLADVGAVDHGPAAALDVVDQDVEAAEAAGHRVDERRNGLHLPQVRAQDHGSAGRARQFALERRQFLLPVEPGHGDRDPGLGQGQGNGLADPFDAPQHQRRLAVQLHAVSP